MVPIYRLTPAALGCDPVGSPVPRNFSREFASVVMDGIPATLMGVRQAPIGRILKGI